jgi:hypothetical protein
MLAAERELENSCMNTQRQTWKVLGACLLAAAAAACGSSAPSSTSPSSTATTPAATTPAATPSSTSAPTAAGTAAIAANWEAFFNNKTPVAKRVSLLQDGSQFASIIQGQAGSGLAATATAKVVKVTGVTATQATVTYDILVSGTPALSNQKGVAVFQDGSWKVGVGSFCGLLGLEGLKKLPAACSASAG